MAARDATSTRAQSLIQNFARIHGVHDKDAPKSYMVKMRAFRVPKEIYSPPRVVDRRSWPP